VTGQLNQATAATLGLDPNALLVSPVAAPVPPRRRRTTRCRPRCGGAARLRALGFYGGAVDGGGARTEVAIENSSAGAGCSPTGSSSATATAMGLTPEALAYR
jgi:hypothetical protein